MGAALAGAIAIAFSAVLVKLADVAPATAAFHRCAWAVPPLLLLARRERRAYGPRHSGDRWRLIAAGVLFGADLVFWHYSIRDVGAGLATVLGNLQVVFVPVIAWVVLSERPERRIIAALPVALLGVVLISGAIGAGAYGRDPALGALWGILTALSYSGFLLLLRAANRDLRRPAGPLLEATAVAAVTSAVAGVAIGDLDLTPPGESLAYLVTLALTSQVLGWLLISISLPRLPAALTSMLLTLQPLGSVLLGVVLLGEEPSALQFLGAAFILAGLVMVSLRRSREPAPV